jgi:hypothetical protein
MAVFRGFWSSVVVMATLCCQSGWQAQASAGFVLNARYDGVVTDVRDTYGLFGSVAAGDSVSGIIQYSSPTVPPDYEDPTFAQYIFPVTPGGATMMTGSVGALDLHSTQNVILGLYNMEDPSSPADSLYGHDFQFIDGDNSLLNTSRLPSGFTLSNLGVYVSLISTDPSLFDFPTPPSELLPIEKYDSYFTSGNFLVTVRDANGHFVEFAAIDFQLTSLSSVPEPTSAILAGVALPLIAVLARRRQR